MNKRSLTLIMATAALVLCLLSPFAGAVTIGYTADSGGESVSISENYDVDNSVTVKETTDISFGNLQVDQERTAEGTGEADLEQTITGKTADGAQYTAENDIFIESEETINAKTYTSATGNTLGVAQTVSVTGDAELHLEGEEGGNMAGQSARVKNGRLNSKQTLDIGNSVRASLYASIWGHSGAGVARSWAEDADGNWAWTWLDMKKGELSTKQEAEADGCATAGQVSDVDAKRGFAGSWAEDADDNWANTYVEMKKGELSTIQGAEADGSATADQVSDVDAKRGSAESWARDADGNNWAETVVHMQKGELSTIQGAEADGSATADQVSDVDAKRGSAESWARDADGNNWANTYVEMKKGELSTVQGAEADGSATADQVSDVDAKRGFAGSWARDADGNNWAETVVHMQKGELSTIQGAEADGSAAAVQVSDVDAKWGFAGSWARDADGNNWAETVVHMQKGELSTIQGAEADGSAAAGQVSDVDAKWGFAGSAAEDADNNRAETVVYMRKGELITVQGAEADGSATAGQVSNVNAKQGFAGSVAEDADGNWAETVVHMKKGELSTVQGAEADGSATAGQVSNVNAKQGFAGSVAEDADGNWAETVVHMKKGELSTVQGAEADGSATAGQVSNVNAKQGFAGSVAEDADGNWAETVVHMKKGELITVQGAEADGSAAAVQVSNVDAKRGSAESWAEDADGNWAGTYVSMEEGTLSTIQRVEADGSATAVQLSDVDAEWGGAVSWAEDADGNWADTYVSMEEGTLITIQRVEADGSATAVQLSDVDAEWGGAESWAEDADGNWAWTWLEMENGELITVQGAEADGSAIAVQDSYIEGNFAWAACEAENADGWVYVDNLVDGNAVLDFEGVALATDDNVIAGQLSYAEGDYINPWTIAENKYGYTFIENVVIDGTLYSESRAIANEYVALSGQYMDATGAYIYRFVEADNNAGPYAWDTFELEDGTVTREESSAAFVNWANAVVIVTVP